MTMTWNSGFIDGAWGSRPLKPEEMVEELKHRIEQICAKPHGYAWCTAIINNKVELVTSPGQLVLVEKPRGVDIQPGDSVRIHGETGQIVAIADRERAFGMIQTVRRVASEHTCEVEHQMETRMVRYVCPRPKAGDRLLLDPSNSIGVRNLGPAPTALLYEGEIGVEWDDIGGNAEAKRALIEAIEEPLLKKDVYAKFGRKPTRGILLFGPPGTGKTLLAKAAAAANARLRGASARATGFVLVRGPELLDKFVGNSENNIRQIFKSARLHQEREGYPALVFIDEADAVLGKRGASRGVEGMERTVVPQFLAEMDGIEDAGAIVMLATNRADALDPAVVRDGRVDRKIYVGRPGKEDAAAILVRALRGKPLEGSAEALAKAAASELWSDAHALATVRVKDGNDRKFLLRDLVSGALLVGVVEYATQLAIRRAIAEDDSDGVVGEGDLREAVRHAGEENAALDHTAALVDFVEPFKTDVVRVDRVQGRTEVRDGEGRIWMPGNAAKGRA